MGAEQKSQNPVRSKRFYGWYLVAIAWVMAFLQGGTAFTLFFKPILDEFGWSRASLSLVSAVILVSMAFLSPFIGKLIDRFGPRLMLLVTILAQTTAAMITGIAGNIGQIYIGRFLSEFKPTHSTQVLINRWFKVFRGRALGIASTGIPLGTLLLSPLTQFLILNWSWRITLLFWAGVSMVVMLPLLIFIKNKPQDIGLVPDGQESTQDYQEEANVVSKTQEHDYSGLDLSQAVRTKGFWLLCGTHLICGIGCGFVTTHIVIFATDIGYSPMIGAIFMSIIGGMSIIGVLVAGQYSDYKKRNRVLALTHLVRSLSFIAVVIAVLAGGGPLWLLFLAMGLFGIGWFTTAPLAAGLAADLFGYKQMGTILGVVMAFHYIGMALGALGGGVIFTQTGSYLGVFVVQGCLEFLAAVGAFIIKKPVIKTRDSHVFQDPFLHQN